MLPREMTGFKGKKIYNRSVDLLNDIEKVPLGRCEKAQMISRHLRRVGLGKTPIFTTFESIIHPVNRKAIRNELKTAERLGTTVDNKHILMIDYKENTFVMDEIGRLREMTFRSIGEGTGQ